MNRLDIFHVFDRIEFGNVLKQIIGIGVLEDISDAIDELLLRSLLYPVLDSTSEPSVTLRRLEFKLCPEL